MSEAVSGSRRDSYGFMKIEWREPSNIDKQDHDKNILQFKIYNCSISVN